MTIQPQISIHNKYFLGFFKKIVNQIAFCILLVFLLLFPFLLFSQDAFFDQNFKTKHIGVEDGLSQGSVYCMLRDSRDFMWFSSYEGLNRYDGHEFKVYRHKPTDSLSLHGNSIKGIVEDSLGNLWIGTEESLNRYNRSSDNFTPIKSINENGKHTSTIHFPFSAGKDSIWSINQIEGIVRYNIHNLEKTVINAQVTYRSNYNNINTIIRTNNKEIWMRQKKGFVRIDSKGNERYYFSDHPNNLLGTERNFLCIFECQDQLLWLGTKNNLIRFNPETLDYKSINFPKELALTDIGDIKEYPKGYLWIGTTNNGIYIFDKESEKIIRHFSSDKPSVEALTNNSSANLYIDKQGICWTNPDPEGVDYIYVDTKPFKKYDTDFFERFGISDAGVRSFQERTDGKLWIAMEREGILLFNPMKDSIEQIINSNRATAFEDNHARCFEYDENDLLWIGGSHDISGLHSLGLDNKWNDYQNTANPKAIRSSNFYWDLSILPNDNMVMATDEGVYFLDIFEKEINILDTLQNIRTGVIFLADDYLLVPEDLNGFYVIKWKDWISPNPVRSPIRHFLANINIKSFYKMNNSDSLWLATSNGLFLTKVEGEWNDVEILKSYTIEDGLPSNYIYGVLADKKKNLWISTNRGISCLNVKAEKFKNYEPNDGISGYEFNTNAFYKTKNGILYFGGVKGFTKIEDSTIKSNLSKPPKVQITSIAVNNESYNTEQYIGETSSIELKYYQSNFSFGLSARDYLSASDSEFMVKLEGFNDNWENIGKTRLIRYTNISPGTYTFKAKVANNDDLWSDEIRALQITIRPPFWKTNWAYLLYILTVSLLLYSAYKLRLNQQLNILEAKRLKDLDTFKTRVFTNITHEFRTPLTVILGQVEELKNNLSPAELPRVHDIKKSGETLLNLVNQMLELSRLESGNHQFHFQQSDILPFLEYLTASFSTVAFSRNISLSFNKRDKELILDFDKEKIQQIVSNLLSNALKFTPEFGKITVDVFVKTSNSKTYLVIKVIDTGIGISQETLPYIFNRFYQVDQPNQYESFEGSGIGLTLVHELVTLLGGKIFVESTLEKGTTFTIELPKTNKASFRVNDVNKRFPKERERENGIKNSRESSYEITILLIEDNNTVRSYISSILKDKYNIIEARNGEIGINKAIEKTPDLIICDVMMPMKNGYEVCRHLKKEISTSHIPIIMLTAKATIENRIEGINLGADAYLTKPFNKEELLAQIHNLLENRKRLQERFSESLKNKDLQLSVETSNDIENQFIQKVNRIILIHLGEETFNADFLALELQMSKSQLYRKLKSLTNISISLYIRKIRLIEAFRLLESSGLTIKEISYKCGFSSPAWFSRVFREEFGHTPTQIKVKKK